MTTVAARVLPASVGVAPGTTTMVLAGPTAAARTPTVGCENPARIARQRYLLFPPGKFSSMAGKAATSIVNAVSPYETIESLKGLGRVARRGLGYLITPVGDNSPNPSYALVAATKTRDYCTRRPERGPNYRWWETSAYEPEGRTHGMNGALGAVPTDLQLASQFTYTPVVSQWIPFKQGTWSPAPWVPPTGPTSAMPQDQGYWTAPLAGPSARVRGALGQEIVTPPPLDPASAAVEELKRHQDRMYLLGIISAAAVASTALVNVFRYSSENKHRRRMSGGRVAAEPAPLISGVRRRRRGR